MSELERKTSCHCLQCDQDTILAYLPTDKWTCDNCGKIYKIPKRNTRTSPEVDVSPLVEALRASSKQYKNMPLCTIERKVCREAADTIQSQQAEIERFGQVNQYNMDWWNAVNEDRKKLQARNKGLEAEIETLARYKDALLIIADMVGEKGDPFAAWEVVGHLQASKSNAQAYRQDAERHNLTLRNKNKELKEALISVRRDIDLRGGGARYQVNEIVKKALAGAEDVGPWQPIETAPKDETRFWAWDGKKCFICWWTIDAYSEGYTRDDEDDKTEYEAGWFSDRWNNLYRDWPIMEKPTHWMPLPPAPEGK